MTPQGSVKKEEATSSGMKTPQNQNLKLKTPSSAGHTPMKMFSKGGVICQELKPGNGPPAKSGIMVSVYYQVRLKQTIRSSTPTKGVLVSNSGLEEAKSSEDGWDLGVEGMKVRGKRRLTIPANFAYGKKGAPPDILPNLH